MTVVNLFGAPSSGKSTLAAGIFYQLKILSVSVELVTEVARDAILDNHLNLLDDQLYLLAMQNRKLRRLEDKVDFAICDSPLLLNIVYGVNEPKHFQELVLEYFNRYHNINIMLPMDYGMKNDNGRVNISYKEAEAIGCQIRSILPPGSYELTSSARLESVMSYLRIKGVI